MCYLVWDYRPWVAMSGITGHVLLCPGLQAMCYHVWNYRSCVIMSGITGHVPPCLGLQVMLCSAGDQTQGFVCVK